MAGVRGVVNVASWESFVGILLAVLATACFNYAPILQKQAVDQMAEISLTRNVGSSVKALFTNRTWLLGALVAVVGGIPYVVALVLVGITVLQPLMSVGFVVLVYFGVRTLGERVGPREYAGIALMVLMPLFLFFASVSNVQSSLLDAGPQLRLVLFTLGGLGLVGALLLADRVRGSANPGLREAAWALSTGVLFALGASYGQAALAFLQAGDLDLVRDLWQLAPLLFAGTPVVLSAAACAVMSGFFNAAGGFFMQIAFQKGNATRVGPINQSMNVVLSVSGGILIFGQVVLWPAWYGLAIAASLLGTALLAKYQAVARETAGKHEGAGEPSSERTPPAEPGELGAP
ncbi:MAG: hypothetical protein ACTSU5_13355 [Promethearchaeota archaeon]